MTFARAVHQGNSYSRILTTVHCRVITEERLFFERVCREGTGIASEKFKAKNEYFQTKELGLV